MCKAGPIFRSISTVWLEAGATGRVRWCRKQVLSGTVRFLATDMHNMTARPPDTEEAVRWIRRRMGEEQLARLVRENPQSVLNNQILPHRLI